MSQLPIFVQIRQLVVEIGLQATHEPPTSSSPIGHTTEEKRGRNKERIRRETKWFIRERFFLIFYY
jgi:hypothetical protein